jgi:hypothetical protein
MIKKIKIALFGLLLIGALATILPTGSVKAEEVHLINNASTAYQTGNYTLSDVRDYFIYLMTLILKVVGVLSLLAFIYGGVIVLTSAGNTSQVKKGMDAIKAAVIGLLITFSSVLIINLTVKTIGASWDVSTGAVKTLTK